jgi:hypothetical protein
MHSPEQSEREECGFDEWQALAMTDSNRRFSAALAAVVTLIALAALTAALVGCASTVAAAAPAGPSPGHYVGTAASLSP